jgi:hypothetical protein
MNELVQVHLSGQGETQDLNSDTVDSEVHV